MTRLALSLFPWIAHPVNRKNPPNVQAGRDEPLPSVSDKEFGPSTLPLLEIRMGFADQPLEHFALPACSMAWLESTNWTQSFELSLPLFPNPAHSVDARVDLRDNGPRRVGSPPGASGAQTHQWI